MRGTRLRAALVRALLAAFVCGCGLLISSGSALASIAGSTRAIARSGTAGFAAASAGPAAGVQSPETAGIAESSLAPDRSHSNNTFAPTGALVQPTRVTNATPGLVASFAGLNHFDQRFGSGGGNQFSVEPPDQGLCVGSDGNGHTRVLEALNDVLRLYDASGAPVSAPTALNDFFGYAPAIVRATTTFGPFVTDPSCVYDAASGHWFIDVLTLDTFPHPGSDGAEHFTGTNHLDLAVSQGQDPAGGWTIYRIPVQDDGTDGTPDHHCSAGTSTATPLPTNPHACLGDYPHIGADANGIYLTTNEYSLFGPEFHGAQVYAFSKAALESGAAQIAITQFDTRGGDNFGFARNGFTLWPSTTPGGGGDPASGGTEYFLSSNAAAEAHDPGDGSSVAEPSTQLLVWALTNTSSIDASAPALSLSNSELNVGLYVPPPRAEQKSGPQPLRSCLNASSCSLALEGIKDPFAETSASLDSNDTRMQQVTWVGGQLWGALDTGLSVGSAQRAGIEWFDVAPKTTTGTLSASLTGQGYLGLSNDNLTYPAIGVTSGGTGAMAFTVLGSDMFPSAGYAQLSTSGPGAVHVAAPGVGPDDGFSDYKLFGNPPGTTRPRWGDYGAAVPVGGDVWLASEYIGQGCTLQQYEATAFLCGNTRTALANWDTRISEVAAP